MAHSAELSQDPTVHVEWHRPDDRFVPVRPCDLVAALAEDHERFRIDPDLLRRFAQALQDVIEQEADTFHRDLLDRYAAVNPDRDTRPLVPLAQQRTPELYARLTRQIAYLLEKANFRQLSQVQVDAAIRTARAFGLCIRLRPDRVQHLAVWARGRGTTTRTRRRWFRPWRVETLTLPVYRRLVVVAQLRDDPHLLVKLFKNIPDIDVEALLPHAEVVMTLQDRLLVFGGGAGALGSTAKLLVGFFMGVATALSQLAWVVLLGAGTMAWRTIMGYRRARSSRDSQRTQHLYFQNLANNGAAIQTLAAIVVQEELKEALLAYVFCHAAQPLCADEADLDRRIEAYLRARFDIRVDFDACDALDKLVRLELFTSRSPLRVAVPAKACQLLEAHWQHRRTAEYHKDQGSRVTGVEGAEDQERQA